MMLLSPELATEYEQFRRGRARVVWPAAIGVAIWLALLHSLMPPAWRQGAAVFGLLVTVAAVVWFGPDDHALVGALRRSGTPAAAHLRRRLFSPLGWFDPSTGTMVLTPLWALLAYRAVFGF